VEEAQKEAESTVTGRAALTVLLGEYGVESDLREHGENDTGRLKWKPAFFMPNETSLLTSMTA